MDHPVTVFYHAPCVDGAAAAWAALQKYGNEATYVPLNHGSPESVRQTVLAHLTPQSHLVFADFCPKPDLLGVFCQSAARVTVYDHHRSAIAEAADFEAPNLEKVFDLKRSGAGIVWDSLFPNQPRPQGITLVEQVDLDQYTQPNFYEIAAVVDSLKIGSLEEIAASMDSLNTMPFAHIVEQGRPMARFLDLASREAVSSYNVARVVAKPRRPAVVLPMVNANINTYGRDFNEKLRELGQSCGSGVAASWFEDGDMVRVSLRSSGSPDCSQLAAELGQRGLGGGGNASNAACRFTFEQFRRVFQRKKPEMPLAVPTCEAALLPA